MAVATGTAILAAASVAAGSSILGAKAQSKAAKSAAKTQAGAADRAAQVQWDMYEQTREDMAPWRDVGTGAVYSLANLMGIQPEGSQQEGRPPFSRGDRWGELTRGYDVEDLQMDPGYEFRLGEGTKALERGAAAKGRLFSGRQGKALTRFGQEMGSNEFANAYNRWRQGQSDLYNRLAGLSGTGQTTAAQTGQFGAGTAARVGQAYQAGGAAQAQGYLGAGAARASGYAGAGTAATQGIQNMLMSRYLDI